MDGVRERLEDVRRRIRECERRWRRPPGSVRLLAVSKRFGPRLVREAAAAGVADFGESYLQEATGKIAALGDLALRWHFVGPLQANKTGGVARRFDWAHSVDREKTAARLDRQRAGAPLDVCVQVRLSDGAGRSGVPLDGAPALCAAVDALPNLRLRGLMGMPEPAAGLDEQRRRFAPLAALFRRLRRDFPAMDTLSMGMSADFDAAIAEGATLIRLGSAVFGPRDA